MSKSKVLGKNLWHLKGLDWYTAGKNG